MWNALLHLTPWTWLGLCTLLLVLEVFGAGGYLLWSAFAAALVGLVAYLLPGLDGYVQAGLFAVLAAAAALLWHRHRRRDATRAR